jgi:hypothetical protein
MITQAAIQIMDEVSLEGMVKDIKKGKKKNIKNVLYVLKDTNISYAVMGK